MAAEEERERAFSKGEVAIIFASTVKLILI